MRAPFDQSTPIGRLKVMRGDVETLDLPLYAGAAVPVGTLSQRTLDVLLEMGTGLVRRALAWKKAEPGS